MPCIAIQIDGTPVATIDLAGMEVVSATVFGALDREAKAVLDSMGGNYSDGGCGYRIWVADKPLQVGQVADIVFLEGCQSADKGQSIDELFPDAEGSKDTDFTITAARVAELRAQPRLHQAFTVKVDTSTGKQAVASSGENNTDYRFNVLWDWTRPEQVRVHLSTYCLDDVLARKGGTSHLEDVISVGDSARFTLVE